MDGHPKRAWTRRAVIAGGVVASASPSFARSMRQPEIVAGTYTREGGKGLYPLTPVGSDWNVGPPLPSIADVSFGVASSRHGHLYLVSEAARGQLAVYGAGYRPLATRPTGGSGPCHAAFSVDQSAIAVANYSSGSVALWRLDRATGVPAIEAQVAQHTGRGPDAARQSGPHAHWVGFSPDSRWLHAVDLGADAIFVHGFDRDTGTLGAMRVAYRAPPGTGPRHLARHPRLPIAYLVAELTNTLTVLDADVDGTFREIDRVSTLPPGFTGKSAAAHIAINTAGTRLYVSNRGHNSIAVFVLEPDGRARIIQHVACGGDWPRFFLLVEDRRELLVANQRSGNVVRLSIERDGRLGGPSGKRLDVPGVAFLARAR